MEIEKAAEANPAKLSMFDKLGGLLYKLMVRPESDPEC